MTDQERIAQLEAENAAQDASIAHLREQVAALEAHVQHLLGRLAKDSHNSSKPPSSDGLARRPRSQRRARVNGSQEGNLVTLGTPWPRSLSPMSRCRIVQCSVAPASARWREWQARWSSAARSRICRRSSWL